MASIFEVGEYQIGRYQVHAASLSGSGWQKEGAALRMLLTNHRIILLPDVIGNKDQTMQPVVIPFKAISRVWNMALGKRDGLLIESSDGKQHYYFVNWNQGSELANEIKELIAPPLQPRISPRMFNSPGIQ